jgi:hypothetical protein
MEKQNRISTMVPVLLLSISFFNVGAFQLQISRINEYTDTYSKNTSIISKPSIARLTSHTNTGTKPNISTRTGTSSSTTLYGIDFEAIANSNDNEECDFTDSNDLSQIDLSKCLPFPTADIIPEDVVTLCMDGLMNNNEPKVNAGLEICFNFSSDRCRAGKLENFK